MDMKKWRIVLFVLFAVIIVGVGSAILIAHYWPKKEIPWWKDYKNIEILLEDERSEEKIVLEEGFSNGRSTMTYVYDRNEEKEYLPQVKVFYKGKEKFVYYNCIGRNSIPLKGLEYDYFDPTPVPRVGGLGKYHISFGIYLKEEDIRYGTNEIYRVLLECNIVENV